jgi:proteasome assembly chaperone (PAC2) family protein
MKIKLLLLITMMGTTMLWSQNKVFWQKQTSNPSRVLKESHQTLKEFQTFSLNTQALRQALNGVAQRNQFSVTSNTVISFPNSEGILERFTVKEASVMHPDLQERFPEIRSYVGQGVDDASSILRFSISPEGFNGMILSANGNTFIEPLEKNGDTYVIFNRENRINYNDDFECEVSERIKRRVLSDFTMKNADDSILRTYRLAVSATGEYTQYHGGTKAQALAAINTTMTRVNGIYEVDFNVTMVLIGNTDDVIYTSTSTDPYGNTTSNYNSQLQNTLTSVIGEANYDVGHLFANLQNNGNAGCIGCVCVNGSKGSGWTSHTVPEGDPFDVDYVAHELGHQFGANHTWTFGGNEGTNAQMEPGSGSTIMGYAGITGATDVQSNSDPYFHAVSIEQVTNYINTTSCQTNTNTGNSVPVVNAGSNYTIPRGTPFVLEGSATDANAGDVLTYCWEQYDENNASSTYPSTTGTSGVAFRSFEPTTNPNRYFPRLETIKSGATSWQWEAVPNVARTLNFRLTVRDNVAGGGTNNSDDMVVSVNSTAGPFVVNSPNTNVTWNAGTTQTVTWNVAGTTGNGVNAASVDIFLSTDGGDTYPITLASGVTNDGSHDIVVPNNQGNQNRIMVRGSNHIFFDISNTNFTIAGQVVCNATVPTGLAASNIGSNSATLSWNAVPGASYDLQYRQVGTSTWTTLNINGISTNLTGLSPLTQYEAQVRSECPDTSTSAFSTIINFTTTDVQLNYCSSASTNVNDEYIGRVQLNTIDNPSGAQFYSDFTGISTTLTKDAQYTITITPTWTGTVYSEGYSVWIDYNRNGDFSDAGEQVWTQAATTATPVSGSFTIPSSAVENSTRMRVSMKYNGIPTACETFTYGEVEDYTVIIEGSGPDTTPPVITLNGASTVNVTQGGTYTELGATATDNIDGDISANIVIGGDTVNTSVLGTYVITYNVSDAAGNNAAEVTRTVTVVEPSTGCSGGISTFPYSESFENTLGDWTQSSSDDIDWTVDANGTPSSNTGPSSAADGNYYVYVEASSPNYPSRRAILNSPCFDLNGVSSASFDFMYHMFGAADMGTIDLEISEDNGATWTSIWSQSGNQGNQWLSASVNLDAYTGKGIQLRFNRFVGSTWQADIAIDDVSLTASGPDTVPPVITLNGASSVSLNVGEAYTELGATATDNVDGDITSNIVIGGDTVDTNTVGTYVITYNVSDAVGNSATEVIRTITVNPDTTAPVITLIGSSSVSLNVGETYTELGATATDNVDGDISANIVIGGDAVNTGIAGTYIITYNVSDAAGNSATEVIRTVTVNPDTTPPVITLIGASSINLTVGDIYTEQGATATDNIDGDITANIIIGGDVVDTNSTGTYVVTYNVSDAAGNAAVEVTRTITVSEVSTGCSGGISSFPYSESFENTLGAWTQSNADDIDWTVDANGTPSSNTGPSSAFSGSYYVYVEASSPNYPSRRAILNSPCFDLSGLSEANFGFTYHMYGAADMGTIDLEISNDDGATWTSIWSQSGNQGNQWLSVNVNLDSYVGGSVQLRFNRFVGSTWQADIAIDSVSLTEGAANNGCLGGISSFPYSESFENTLGAWSQSNADDIDWTIDANGTPSSNTGPSSAADGTYYVYVEASSPNYPSRRAILNSPCFDLSSAASATFNFNYHQYGAADMGTLDLEISEDNGATWTSIWNSSGNLGNSWQSASVSLSAYVGANVQLRFNRFVGSTWQADIAIDNVSLTTAGTTREDVTATTDHVKEFKLYPNPVKGSSLNVLTDYKEVSYEIYNTLGHLVAKGNLVNNKIDISSLEGSVYQIRFTTEEGTMTKRFIKQ